MILKKKCKFFCFNFFFFEGIKLANDIFFYFKAILHDLGKNISFVFIFLFLFFVFDFCFYLFVFSFEGIKLANDIKAT